MENVSLFDILLGALNLVLGWLFRILWEAIKDMKVAHQELSTKVQQMEVLMIGDYVKRQEVDDKYEALFRKLDRMEDKIDRKLDK